MQKLILETLSSRDTGGQQTLIDLTGSLWDTETISTVVVTPVDLTKLTVVSATANGSEITIDGRTVAIGKGVLLVINTDVEQSGRQRLTMRVVGTEQFKRDYDLIQPVSVAITE